MTYKDIFKITQLSYDEITDELHASAYQHQSHTLDAPVDADSATVKFEMMISSEGALIRSVSKDHLECDFTYAAAVLSAFAHAFQRTHDQQSPLDSPYCTELSEFEVTF